MSRLRWIAIEVVQTLLRMLPFPARTGLRRIGHPDRTSPVLLTGNFQLTVERLKRALAGIDAYLLVANSRGVNVWCAATGGLLTDHDVVSVLKTSGIADLVDRHEVILPQLAATGVDGKAVLRRSGWRVVWGPAEFADVPRFLERGRETTREMRRVQFPWRRRFEMAVAWAFPISLLSLVVLPFWAGGVAPLMGLVWGLSLLIFLGFPLYQDRLRGGGKNHGFVFFDIGERGLPLVLWGLFLLCVVAYALAAGEPSGFVLRWGLASLVVLGILCLDLMGSTPVYKSGLHEDRLLRIELDESRCRGAAFCERVCPKDVFEVDTARRMATLPRAEACVQCGACIVQCPFDALYFRDPHDAVIPPDTIRRFKLNLLGHRTVPGSEAPEAGAPASAGDAGRGGNASSHLPS